MVFFGKVLGRGCLVFVFCFFEIIYSREVVLGFLFLRFFMSWYRIRSFRVLLELVDFIVFRSFVGKVDIVVFKGNG